MTQSKPESFPAAIKRLSIDQINTALVGVDTARAISKLADAVTGHQVFVEYQKLKSENTLKSQHRDLRLFGDFLNSLYERAYSAGVDATLRLKIGELYREPASWQIVSHGLVKLFKRTLEDEGYSLTTVNRNLSTIRQYANLAASAGFIEPDTNALIQAIRGYLGTEQRNIDKGRSKKRKSKKKATAVSIPKQVSRDLMAADTYPDTPIGIRDRLILLLLLNFGLRSSELAGLRIENFDLNKKQFSVYRMKTDQTDLLLLGDDVIAILYIYLPQLPEMSPCTDIENPGTPLLRSVHKAAGLRAAGMTSSAVSKVVTKYGKLMAIEHNMPSLEKMSAHDGRHQWATEVLASGAQVDQLQQAGGWKSPSMPLRYANKRKVANEGIELNWDD